MGTVVSVGVCPTKSRTKQKPTQLQESHSAPEISQPESQANGTAHRSPKKDGQYSRAANKRVAVLLSNYHEEYQTLADELPEIVFNQVDPNLREHPMIHGKYCLVRDSESERDHLIAVSLQQDIYREKSKGRLPILGLSQPSACKLKRIVKKCASKNPYWIALNVRSDPCLFSYVNNDWHPYVLRKYEDVQTPLRNPFKSGIDLDADELAAREEVLQDLKALREEHFYFYDDITFFENQPQLHLANQPDYLMVSEEVYNNAISRQSGMRYIRLNFSYQRFPLEEEIDRLIAIIRELCNEILPKAQLTKPDASDVGDHLIGVIVTSRKIHDGSIQLGMSIAYLILRALHSFIISINPSSPVANAFNKHPRSSNRQSAKSNGIKENKNGEIDDAQIRPGYKKRSECQLLTTQHQRLKAGKFQFLRQVGRYLTYMVQIKEEVDKAIDDCSGVINLREEVLETVLELEAMQFSYDMGHQAEKIVLQNKCVHQLERYYMLICFNAYLREQLPLRFSLKFTDWMRRHPKLYRVLPYLDLSEWYTTVDLLKGGQRILLLDSSQNIDELCTYRETGLANFRQLVGWPIYGASQPACSAISRMQAMMTKAYWNVALENMRVDEKLANAANEESNRTPVSMPTVIWVCLRDEYVYDRAGETGTWRSKDEYTTPILLNGISGLELEELEEKFVQSLNNMTTSCTPYSINIETNKLMASDKQLEGNFHSSKRMFKNAFTMTEALTGNSVLDSQNSNIPDSYIDYVKKHAEYHRIPIPTYGPPTPAIFDQILRLVVNNARGLMTSTITVQSLVDASAGVVRRHSCHRSPGTSTDGVNEWHLPNANHTTVDRITSTNIVFFCESGKERTSLGMSIAGLVYCHIVGFAFGYRVDEEERISLRGAKYTKGDFEVIQRLIRMIPHGHQVKREVDYVLDRCFDSMSMMHFHVREQIYFTYVKFREETDPNKKVELKRQSLAYLEAYFYLILFNFYLHDCQSSRWKYSFETWLEQVTNRFNYMDLLDNLGFPEFEKPDDLRRIRERWRPYSTRVSQTIGIC